MVKCGLVSHGKRHGVTVKNGSGPPRAGRWGRFPEKVRGRKGEKEGERDTEEEREREAVSGQGLPRWMMSSTKFPVNQYI